MIIADVYTHSNGKIVACVLRGHNSIGKNGHGYNIHCAEISALSQSACLSIANYLNRDVTGNNEHGGLGIELKNAPDELTEAVFQTMLIGLRNIEKVAPNSIKISMIEMDASAEANLQSKINSMQPSPVSDLPELNVKEVKICVDIHKDDGGNTIGFSIEERKTKAKEFKIYRASIWALAESAFFCIKDYLKRNLRFKHDSHRLAMKLKNSPDKVTEAVFQTMLIGLLEIKKLAPQVVNVTEKFSLGGENK
jgi:hypothetical protein